MSRNTCVKMLLLCVFMGVLYSFDIITMLMFGNGESFVIFGTVWVRYILLAIVVALIFIIPRLKNNSKELKTFNFSAPQMFFICGAVALYLTAVTFYHAYSQYVFPNTNFGHMQGSIQTKIFALIVRLVFASSALVYSVFCFICARKTTNINQNKSITKVLGLIGALAFCVLPIILYSENPSSVHRIVYIMRICCALSALFFYIKLLGLFYIERTKDANNALFSGGLCVFLLCTCINIPNTFYIIFIGSFNFFDIGINLFLIPLGIVGALSSLAICNKVS